MTAGPVEEVFTKLDHIFLDVLGWLMILEASTSYTELAEPRVDGIGFTESQGRLMTPGKRLAVCSKGRC